MLQLICREQFHRPEIASQFLVRPILLEARFSKRKDRSVESQAQRPANFLYAPMFPLGPDTTSWRKLPIEGVRTISVEGRTVLRIAPEALSELAVRAFHDVSYLLRPAHLAQLRAILDDPEASANDRFVALDLLKNANIAAGGVLPMCQDTGTAIVFGKKGQREIGRAHV